MAGKGHSDGIDWRAALFGPSVLLITALMAMSAAACWILRGQEVFYDSFVSDFWMLVSVLPKMALAFIVAALVQRLVSREFIARWLGDKAGIKGDVIATGVGIVTPGGPMMSFPIMSAMAQAGTGRAALIAYLTSWECLGFQRVLGWELPLLGVELTLIRIAASIPLPFLAAWLSRFVGYVEPAKAPGE